MSNSSLREIPRSRDHLISSYVDNMKEFLKMEFPKATDRDLDTFIRGYTEEWCGKCYARYEQVIRDGGDLDKPRPKSEMLWPTMKIVRSVDPNTPFNHSHSYGNLCFYDSEELLSVSNEYRDKIVSPFGTFYETANRQASFLKGMVDTKSKLRKSEKKLMLQAKKEGNRTKETFHNNNQATIKINMNSLIGAMGSGFNFLASIANFNSVTSIARFFIMNSYAHAERFLEGNFYFRTEEQLINFLVTCRRRGPRPDLVVEVCNRYGIHLPTWNEVYDFVAGCLHRYMFTMDHPEIKRMLNSMHPGELAFVYYMSNMKQLVFRNEDYFRPWIADLLSEEHVEYRDDVDPSEIRSFDGDMTIVLSTIYSHWMPLNAKGNSISIYDCIDAHPDLAKKFVCIGRFMDRKFKELDELFQIFMNHKVGIGYVSEHKDMFRDTVILSDTDSIIFTTKSWIDWYSGDLKLDHTAFCLNALVVYWLSKANAFILFNVSEAFGAVGRDMLTMNMKNEFMMPIEILTSLKKHYASILKIQEGVYYSTPRLDIKGVNLRGSNFSKSTLNYVTWFIQSIIDEIYTTGKVSVRQKIYETLQFERLIYDSLMEGDTRYLTVEPVKMAEEYRDSDRTIYFNYLFWEHVFGDTYGNIMVPTKCFVLPLSNIRSDQYKKFLDEHHPEISQKLTDFMIKYPSKDISRIPINPLTDRIPVELQCVTNFKAIIFANARPLYLILSSLGVNNGRAKSQTALFSENYGWVASEETASAKVHTE